MQGEVCHASFLSDMFCCRQWSWADSSVDLLRTPGQKYLLHALWWLLFKKTKYEKSSLIYHILTSPSDMPLCWFFWEISHVSSPLQPSEPCLRQLRCFTAFLFLFKGCQKSLIFHIFLFPFKGVSEIFALNLRPRVASHISTSVSCSGAGMMYTCKVGEEQPSIKGEHFKSCSEPDQEQTEAWKQLEETLGAKCPNSRCWEAANKLTAQFFKSCPGSPVSLLHG